MPRVSLSAVVLMVAAIGSLPAAPPADPQELSLPARLHAVVTIINPEVDPRTEGARTGVGRLVGVVPQQDNMKAWVQFPNTSAQLTIEIRRWTLEEEEDALRAAIDSGGMPAVIKVTKNLKSLGTVHVGGEGVLIRAASTWMTDYAQRIRLVFNSRLVSTNTNADLFTSTSRALDILDLTLPHGEKYGTGTLITATQVEYKKPGLIEGVTYAMGSATNPVDQVERLAAKSE